MRWITRLSRPVVCVAVLLAATGCTSATVPGTDTAPSSATTQWGSFVDVRIGALEADENFSSSSVEQWVKQTDFVAVVRIESEEEIPPAKVEIERGEGLIGRSVTASVEKLVWSHPQVKQKLPDTFTFNAFGWAFKNGLDSKFRIGLGDQPYLLPGHNHVMALRYVEFGCPGRIDPEDGDPVKVWAPLGSQAIIPFDGTLGAGEFEGKKTEQAGSKDTEKTFRKAMLGQDTDWIAKSLSQVAADDPKLAHDSGPSGCDGE